jgi:hypothetical protein
MPVIDVCDLRKTYGDILAVAGISCTLEEEECPPCPVRTVPRRCTPATSRACSTPHAPFAVN